MIILIFSFLFFSFLSFLFFAHRWFYIAAPQLPLQWRHRCCRMITMTSFLSSVLSRFSGGRSPGKSFDFSFFLFFLSFFFFFLQERGWRHHDESRDTPRRNKHDITIPKACDPVAKENSPFLLKRSPPPSADNDVTPPPTMTSLCTLSWSPTPGAKGDRVYSNCGIGLIGSS